MTSAGVTGVIGVTLYIISVYKARLYSEVVRFRGPWLSGLGPDTVTPVTPQLLGGPLTPKVSQERRHGHLTPVTP